MYFHKEGRKIIFITLALVLVIYAAMVFFVREWTFFHGLFMCILLLFWMAITLFFRIPRRIFTEDSQQLIAPADGTIVTIEEVMEKEYIKEECVMISIFMSGTDVHVNRYPCDGVVEYAKYHRGNYFIASYPKSSDLNERTTVGLRLNDGQKIVLRQVAGTMARRIVCYAREGEVVKQNQEMGFIKFGSRVDIFVPKSFKINVDLQDKVRNAISPIAHIVPLPDNQSQQ
ncbi:MAG: phosphatidylserine decarboxylase family protein [Bacteroidales bacterium]|nr:phosphatidylserine decarboxylase family protein [Bacteroidales bacterium]